MLSRVLPLFLLAAVAVSGCDSLGGGGDEATLTGQVVNASTNRAVVGATVQVLSMGIEQLTDSTGGYVAALDIDSVQTVQIVAFKTGYAADTVTATVEAGQALTVPALLLRPSEAGDGTSGPAASITLSDRSPRAVGVSGTGSAETAQLVFVALDAYDRPVDAAHAVDINVSIIQGPGGGEFLNIPRARTDENGEATVTLTSGTAAGVVQIETRATVGGREVRSQPTTLVIHGGFPSQDHFSVGSALNNFPGYRINGLTNDIEALLGDRYGNPVQPGTQVYFTTDGGVIGGSSATNADGIARVTLFSGNPRPAGRVAVITARSSGADGVPVETTSRVLFSGVPQIEMLQGPDGFPGTLPTGSYRYRVSDDAGFPLAGGTTITVTVEGENVESSGRTSVTLEDRIEPGPNKTDFQFSIRRADTELPASVDLILIEVEGPNGTATASWSPANMPRGPVVGRSPVGAR